MSDWWLVSTAHKRWGMFRALTLTRLARAQCPGLHGGRGFISHVGEGLTVRKT
jgi:hypothetical protein